MKGGVTLEDIKKVRGKGIMTIEGRIRKGKEGNEKEKGWKEFFFGR